MERSMLTKWRGCLAAVTVTAFAVLPVLLAGARAAAAQPAGMPEAGSHLAGARVVGARVAITRLAGSQVVGARVAIARLAGSRVVLTGPAGPVPRNGWHPGQAVAGLSALNAGHDAAPASVSCAQAGYCSAGGFYTDRAGHRQAFVVDEVAGRWGQAIGVPGMAGLNARGDAKVVSVSCAAPGDCAADGSYLDSSGRTEFFVVSETAGRWGRAIEAPGSAPLNTMNGGQIGQVSCSAPGYCVAVGAVRNSEGLQAFVVSETGGRWGDGVRLTGGALSTVRSAAIVAVSCPQRGDCTVGGSDRVAGGSQAFVDRERNGAWRPAVTISGAGLTGSNLRLTALSCAAPGDCAAAGTYAGAGKPAPDQQAFVASEHNGQWAGAQDIAGLVALNVRDRAAVTSVSCSAAGDCAAVGYYGGAHSGQSFVVDETGGNWNAVQRVLGLAKLTNGSNELASVSCRPFENCVAAGFYFTARSMPAAYAVTRAGGHWRAATVIASPAGSVTTRASVTSVSCAAPTRCVAVGTYTARTGSGQQVFVAHD
jgi:hypothetical protein